MQSTYAFHVIRTTSPDVSDPDTEAEKGGSVDKYGNDEKDDSKKGGSKEGGRSSKFSDSGRSLHSSTFS
jgi:hypothetical protein